MRISGILPLRNGTRLGYPYEVAIRSLFHACDEVVVAVDPTSEDDTMDRVRAIARDTPCLFAIVESVWDMSNHDGGNDEIARQTQVALDRATGDWVLSLQADEVMHEAEADALHQRVSLAEARGETALELDRLYFFGALDTVRDNWTVPINRLFRRGDWIPDAKSGAMYFVRAGRGDRPRAPLVEGASIYHYSRVGDPLAIARRVRNLDLFYHPPDRVATEGEVAPYTFEVRKLDTYALGSEAEVDADARLLLFPVHRHPASVLAHYGVKP